jgi:hypothetical protein
MILAKEQVSMAKRTHSEGEMIGALKQLELDARPRTWREK